MFAEELLELFETVRNVMTTAARDKNNPLLLLVASLTAIGMQAERIGFCASGTVHHKTIDRTIQAGIRRLYERRCR